MHHEAIVEHDGAKNLIAEIEASSLSDDEGCQEDGPGRARRAAAGS